ncbi:hypothetical protein RUND412_009281 [Rhizina undulata]
MAHEQHYPPTNNQQRRPDLAGEYDYHPSAPQGSRPPPRPNGMNGSYGGQGGGGGGGGGGAGMVGGGQNSRRPPPPMGYRGNEGGYPSFPNAPRRQDPMPPGSVPIENAMRAMDIRDRPVRSKSAAQMGVSRPGPQGNMRGPPPPHMRRPMGPPGEQRRPMGPPGEQRRPMGPPGEQRRPMGPPGEQRRPMNPGEQRRPMNPGEQRRPMGPGEQRGPPPQGRGFQQPVMQRQNMGYEQGWNDQYQDPNYQEQSSGYPEEQEFMPLQRSQTMPAAVQAPQQYTAYNPARHGTPASLSGPQNVYQHREDYTPQRQSAELGFGQRRVPEPEYPRESVGALIDAYYDEPDTYDDQFQQQAYQQDYQAAQLNGSYNGNTTPRTANFSRPIQAPPQQGNDLNYYGDEQNYYGNDGFAQQAHRSQSQPDLRRGPQSQQGYQEPYQGHYDGAVEMPVGMPVELPAFDDGNSFMPPPGNVQMRAPPPRSGTEPVYRQGTPAAPSNPGQVPLADSLPHHPSPESLRRSDSLPHHPSPDSLRHSDPQKRAANTDGLPEHPPPIRPGLIQEPVTAALPNHPPPLRQYSPERTTQQKVPPQNTPVTQAELEQIRQAAKSNPADQQLQLNLAKKMVEAASVLASEGGKADVKTTRKNRETYILDAHKIVKKLTNSSHPYPEAMFYLATCYGNGNLGLQIDHEKAFGLYQSAAKLGHGPSAYRTAVCCEIGAGIRKDPMKAMTWYKKAAVLKDTAAMYKLGMILLKGLLGQPRNARDGINWLKRAAGQADEENPHALHELGLLYERTDGNETVIPDMTYARELFTKAAELGYPPAQFRLGCAYEYGTMGFPIDPRMSITWYSRAAMKGEPESELALSGWYLTGSEGVIQQSDTEAYLWLRKAAEKGLAKAEYGLGYFIEVGIGVAPNVEEAKRWYYKAASQNHPRAQQRLQELKKGGGPVQRRERLSRSNKSKDDADCVIM